MVALKIGCHEDRSVCEVVASRRHAEFGIMNSLLFL
jgi:hypothetical protein